MLTLADIVEAITGNQPAALQPRRVEYTREETRSAKWVINEAAIDSRQIIPGAMFIALPGERTDGHNFIGEAFKNGAGIALIQRELPNSLTYPVIDLREASHDPSSARRHADAVLDALDAPNSPYPGEHLCLLVVDTLAALQTISAFYRRKNPALRVIGITGSVGKSTTKELVAEVLSQRYRTLKNQGNLNNEIGLPLTLLRLGCGHQRAVLEMGFYVPGEITLLCDLAQPAVGVITNVGTVHAERAGSQEAIARGKAELVQALPPADQGGVAILNYDDPWVRAMAEKTRARVFFYGLDPQADLWADEIDGLGLDGIRFRLHYRNEILHLRVPLIGRHSVHTALRAAAVGLVEGLTWSEIISGLAHGHTQLRLVAVRTQSGALLLDDSYNASPESTLAALNLLAELDGYRIAVLGDMRELGQYERQGHERVGVRAAEVAQRLIAVGESARIIVEAARKAGLPPVLITWVPDANAATEVLRREIKEGDVVLVKGSNSLRMDRIVSALEVTSDTSSNKGAP
jgi:UDP-N-acetylmuramoyl-tripeptide--D-alanyl-D-alanine ligase